MLCSAPHTLCRLRTSVERGGFAPFVDCRGLTFKPPIKSGWQLNCSDGSEQEVVFARPSCVVHLSHSGNTACEIFHIPVIVWADSRLLVCMSVYVRAFDRLSGQVEMGLRIAGWVIKFLHVEHMRRFCRATDVKCRLCSPSCEGLTAVLPSPLRAPSTRCSDTPNGMRFLPWQSHLRKL